MDYEIIFSDQAFKDLTKLDKNATKRIKKKLQDIRSDPFTFAKRLKGLILFSLRVGDYRVIIDVKPSTRQILVIKIDHRRHAYEGL